MKKIVALLLVLTMVLATACFAEADAKKEYPFYVPDLSGKTVTLMSADTYADQGSFSDIMPIFKKYEEMTGVKLVWETVNTDYNTVLQTRLSSGINLPDVVSLGTKVDKLFAVNFIEDGILANVNDYMEDYAPNMYKFFYEDRPDIRKSLTYYDGGLYVLPNTTYSQIDGQELYIERSGDNVIWYRKDLAEAVGINEAPTTIEEMHELLLAYKENYPEMIPMLVRDWSTWCSVYVFSGAYGMHWEHMDGCDEYFYPDEDNNIVFEPLTDACRAFLEEMAVWYGEGLFGFNADRTGLAASNKLCSVWVGTYGSCLSTNGLLHDNGFEGEFDAVPWLYGPEGKRGVGMRAPFAALTGVVAGENAATAIQFLDFAFYSEIGQISDLLGVYEDNWNFDENGNIYQTEETIQEWQVEKTSNRERVGGDVHTRMTNIQSTKAEEYYFNMKIEHGFSEPLTERQLEVFADWKDACYQILPFMFYSEDETQIYTQYYGDIKTYVQEMMCRFIMGEESFDNWDAYVEKVHDLHIDEVVEVVQAAYDRYVNN